MLTFAAPGQVDNPVSSINKLQRDLTKHINTTVAYAALALSASCYGLWHILCNVAMTRGCPAMIFALYRCAGGMGCCLLALKLCPELGTKSRKTKGQSIFGDTVLEYNHYSLKDELMFLLLGLCLAGNVCGFIIASTMLPALTCSIFSPLVPVGTALISIAWGIEEKDRLKLGGLCLAVLGAIVVVLFEDHVVKPPTALTTLSALAAAKGPMATAANSTMKTLINGTVGNATAAVGNATAANATNATVAATTAMAGVANKTGLLVRTAAPIVANAVEASSATVNWKFVGYAFIFLSTVSAAMYFVLLKNVLKTYTPVRATALAYGHATGFVLLGAVARYGLDPWAWVLYGDSVSWACLIYAAVVTTGLTYTIQAWAVGVTSPSTVTAFTTLSPVAAALISIAFLNVHLEQCQLIGGAMIMVGLWVNITVQAREHSLREKVPLRNAPFAGGVSQYSSTM